jgi:dihydrofolate synthase/folylpolyglutamate synthase
MKYRDAMGWLDGLLNYERTPAIPYNEIKLQRMEALLCRLGNPEARLPTVLIAGTKGKGSTAAMLSALLRAGGARVGLYTKPHLVDYRERIRVDGRRISESDLAGVIAEVIPHAEAGGTDAWGPPTYFEVSVALALLHFVREGVAHAVVEVGIGGRLDATNACRPNVSVITPISYDHMAVLGDTLTRIAAEKAGILRPGGRAVLAPQPEEAQRALDEAVARHGACVTQVGRDVGVVVHTSSLDGVTFAVRTPGAEYVDLRVPLLGRHQATNAAVAIAAAEAIEQRRGASLAPDVVRAGLAGLRWPGREEVLSRDPLVIIDVAHNPASMRALRDTLRELAPDRRMVLLFGMIAGHDPQETVPIIAPIASEVVVTTPDHPRSHPAADVGEVVRRHATNVTIEPRREAAYALALARTGPADALVVTGSFFLAGGAREWLRRHLSVAIE